MFNGDKEPAVDREAAHEFLSTLEGLPNSFPNMFLAAYHCEDEQAYFGPEVSNLLTKGIATSKLKFEKITSENA